MPIAYTKPNSDSALSEKPSPYIMAKVPISDTGTAANGISAARQFCRNNITTITTKAKAANSVVTTASIEPRTKIVGS